MCIRCCLFKDDLFSFLQYTKSFFLNYSIFFFNIQHLFFSTQHLFLIHNIFQFNTQYLFFNTQHFSIQYTTSFCVPTLFDLFQEEESPEARQPVETPTNAEHDDLIEQYVAYGLQYEDEELTAPIVPVSLSKAVRAAAPPHSSGQMPSSVKESLQQFHQWQPDPEPPSLPAQPSKQLHAILPPPQQQKSEIPEWTNCARIDVRKSESKSIHSQYHLPSKHQSPPTMQVSTNAAARDVYIPHISPSRIPLDARRPVSERVAVSEIMFLSSDFVGSKVATPTKPESFEMMPIHQTPPKSPQTPPHKSPQLANPFLLDFRTHLIQDHEQSGHDHVYTTSPLSRTSQPPPHVVQPHQQHIPERHTLHPSLSQSVTEEQPRSEQWLNAAANQRVVESDSDEDEEIHSTPRAARMSPRAQRTKAASLEASPVISAAPLLPPTQSKEASHRCSNTDGIEHHEAGAAPTVMLDEEFSDDFFLTAMGFNEGAPSHYVEGGATAGTARALPRPCRPALPAYTVAPQCEFKVVIIRS